MRARCDDGNPCTSDSCDSMTGECANEPNSNYCNVGNVCTSNDTCRDRMCVSGEERICSAACEACDPLVGCVVMPREDCRKPIVAQKASLTLKDNATDAGDKIAWKWIKGEHTGVAAFGDPLNTDDYTLCVYHDVGGSPSVFLSTTAPTDSVCPLTRFGKLRSEPALWA